MALATDTHGGVWAGGEDGLGLWRYDPTAKKWTHFPVSANLPADIYALAVDHQGRVWAGTLNSGVCVFNGHAWRSYDAVTGPLGSRVFALAVSPIDGDVWIAGDSGLARYSQAHAVWTYYTRAEGLPSDQLSCLAFDKRGTLYAGTMCNGLAIASAADGYKHWRTVTGWDPMPLAPTGKGLPSNLINAVLVSRANTVFVGTTHGLASSRDGGRTWRFRRGADWRQQGGGLYDPAPFTATAGQGNLLLEDYVTSLAEDGQGDLYIGHRSKGWECLAPSGERLSPAPGFPPGDDYVIALMPQGHSLLVGTYGGGLHREDAEGITPVSTVRSTPSAAFPSSAPPPTVNALQAMTARIQTLKGELPIGGAVYLGQDWQTEGDWVGRFGRQYARLFSIATPMDQTITWRRDYDVTAEMGPHHAPGDSLRHWLASARTQNHNSLYSPVDGFRSLAEIDDHGESVRNQGYGGPDIWITVTVPEGVHRLSLYFYNDNGHNVNAAKRDYLVEVKRFRDTPADVERSPALASARVKDFTGGGVYQSFVVRGPSRYYVKINKNNSFNTICSAVFLDKLLGPVTSEDQIPLPYMGGVSYQAPSLAMLPPSEPVSVQAAQALWSALDAAEGRSGGTALERSDRLLAYRAIVYAGAPQALVDNWRWRLHLWTGEDRRTFLPTMAKGYQSDQDPFWYVRGLRLQASASK